MKKSFLLVTAAAVIFMGCSAAIQVEDSNDKRAVIAAGVVDAEY